MVQHEVGILHPGSMGISLAATVKNSGHPVYWASAGRSRESHQRAEQQELIDLKEPEALLQKCSFILSICPPHAALEMARWVADNKYQGLYLDANAISPAKSQAIAALFADSGTRYVDGGVIGGPAWKPGTTWLHLSGPDAVEAAGLFAAGPLETNVVGEQIGQASALKMVFAANTKGATALLCASMAVAEVLGVSAALKQQWMDLNIEPAQQSDEKIAAAVRKAWRFAGEMEEIAETFASAGLPGEFHQASAEIFRRLMGHEHAAELPDIQALLQQLKR